MTRGQEDKRTRGHDNLACRRGRQEGGGDSPGGWPFMVGVMGEDQSVKLATVSTLDAPLSAPKT